LSILIHKKSRILIQGITGREGQFHASLMGKYGSKVVAGVSPSCTMDRFGRIPIYRTVSEAVSKTQPDVSVLFVPKESVMAAAKEAIDAGLKLLILVTKGVPVQDVLLLNLEAEKSGAMIIGPGSSGILSVGECKAGVMPVDVFKRGSVGIVSKSATVSYEICQLLSKSGVGQSSYIGIGSEPTSAFQFAKILRLFEDDPKTDRIVIVGESRGFSELKAASVLFEMSKPVVVYLLDNPLASAPFNLSGFKVPTGEWAENEVYESFVKSGARVVKHITEIPEILKSFVRV
jgi:succinyl-CoA synthetase alpha subunit